MCPTRENKAIRVCAKSCGLETSVKLKWVSNGISVCESKNIKQSFICELKFVVVFGPSGIQFRELPRSVPKHKIDNACLVLNRRG